MCVIRDSIPPGPPDDLERESGLALSHLAAIRGRNYVCLALNMIGNDQSSDPIVQIGALRVESGAVTDRFFEPTAVIERPIRVVASPRTTAFRTFVGDLPLVAQDVHRLGMPVLGEMGLEAAHPVVNSLELAWLVMPHLERHDLESLARWMGLSDGNSDATTQIRSWHSPSIRGQSDALHTAALQHRVLETLLDRLEVQLCDPFRGRIFRALLPDALGEAPDPLDPRGLYSMLTPRGFPGPDEAPTAGRIASAGEEETDRAFRRLIETTGRQWREGQGEMVRLVAHTLDDSGIRLLEAPTGTGKSIGLAFPAIQHALATGGRVLLSTHTRNLQDQLERDLRRLSEEMIDPFRFAVLKGRGNYLCVRALVDIALETAAEPAASTLSTRHALACLMGWAASQASEGHEGNLDEFSHGLRERSPAAERLIDAVRAERGRCDDDTCQEASGCFRGLAHAGPAPPTSSSSITRCGSRRQSPASRPSTACCSTRPTSWRTLRPWRGRTR